ncbi:autotransporter domain-containing protein [Pseudomonas sp. LPB0260]|uniref:autotransporter family protein n=1 Tax=Pseudomonas sp. LPB0260 TaxID=2614442 RepID=UPI0015C2879E|nr:autotransporter outer membrane beta-barrel domain-containing protein [Pseudomonas sp. LPB0260]QLC72440.1 autotransporter domain-containing protein [Pseudomonas sp. LPB0260]QLC75216.1 autotransporter domain-containing protein [Pseudomonas sp. LPB0260]
MHTPKPVHWKRHALASAIALAAMTAHATPSANHHTVSTYEAPLPHVPHYETWGTWTGPTPNYRLNGTDSLTVTSSGTIDGGDATAVQVESGSTGVVIDNSGTITSNTAGISSTSGEVDIVNQAGAVIRGTQYGVRFNEGSGLSRSLVNHGLIETGNRDDDPVYAIYTDGDLSGSLINSASGQIIGRNVEESSLSAWGVRIGGGLTGTLSNQGLIEAHAHATDDHEANAYAIEIRNALTGSLSNSGTIRAKAISATSSASAFGVYIRGALDGSLNNSGTISADADANDRAAAYGIRINDGISGELINSSIISATAGAGAQKPRSAYAYGINNHGQLTGNLTNSGTVSATAEAERWAEAYAIKTGSIASSLTNQGSIRASAISTDSEASALSVYVTGNIAGSLNNSGTISADAAAYDNAYAYGILIGGNLTGELNNSGTISANATGNYASAYGIRLNALHGSLTNSGSISARAISPNDSVSAYGIYIRNGLHDSATLTNSGTISVLGSAAQDSVYGGVGIHVNGDIASGARLSNSGIIDVELDALVAQTGAGIYVSGTMAGELVNSGTIGVRATLKGTSSSNLHGVYVNALSGSLTNTSTGTISASLTMQGGDHEESVYGLFVRNLSGSLLNQGYIGATANSIDSTSSAYAIALLLDNVSGTVSNSGTLEASLVGAGSSQALWARGTGTINNSGKILGAVNLHGMSLHNSGLLAPGLHSEGAASSWIGGDYTQTADGTLRIAAMSASDFSQLNVSGTAYLSSNAKIDVDVRKSNTLAIGETLTSVLSAGTLDSDGTFKVTDNSALFNFQGVKNGDSVDLLVKKGMTALDAVTSTKTTPATGAARTFDRIIDQGASGDMQSVVDTLGRLETEQEVSDAVSQTLPLFTAGMNLATNNALRGVSGVVQSRQASLQGRASGDAFYGDEKLWLKPFGSWVEQDDRGGVAGYDANIHGLVIGADAAVSETDRLGLAFAYSRSDIDGNSAVSRQSGVVDSYQLVLFGSHNLDAATSFDYQLDVGHHNNEGQRHINFGGLNRTAEADYDSWSAHLGGALSHSLQLSEQTRLTPSVRADYTWINDESYREKGAGALNLNADSRTTEALVLGVGSELAHDLSDRLTLTAKLGVGYDVLNEQASITTAFAGAPSASFTTEGLDPSPWIATGGLELSFQANEQTQLSVAYDVEGREDFTHQTVSAKVRWGF